VVSCKGSGYHKEKNNLGGEEADQQPVPALPGIEYGRFVFCFHVVSLTAVYRAVGFTLTLSIDLLFPSETRLQKAVSAGNAFRQFAKER